MASWPWVGARRKSAQSSFGAVEVRKWDLGLEVFFNRFVLMAILAQVAINIGFEVWMAYQPELSAHPDRSHPYILVWDADFELEIAQLGYEGLMPHYVAKYPLFSLLAQPLMWFGLEAKWALFVLKILFNWWGFGELYRLVVFLSGRQKAQLAVGYTAFWAGFAGGYAWLMVYPEGLFLGLTSLTLLFFYREKWVWAGLTLALALVCRPQGAVLAGTLVISLLVSGRLLREWKKVAWTFVPAGISFLSWMLYSSWIYGKFPGAILVQSDYGRNEFRPVWNAGRFIHRALFELPYYPLRMVVVGVVLFVILQSVLVLLKARRFQVERKNTGIPWEIVFFGLLATWIPLSQATGGVPRFQVVTCLVWVWAYLPFRYHKYLWAVGLVIQLVFLVEICTSFAPERTMGNFIP